MWLVCENAKSASPAAANRSCNGNSHVKEKIKRNWTGKETVEVISGQQKVQLRLVAQDESQAIEDYRGLLYEVRLENSNFSNENRIFCRYFQILSHFK